MIMCPVCGKPLSQCPAARGPGRDEARNIADIDLSSAGTPSAAADLGEFGPLSQVPAAESADLGGSVAVTATAAG